MYCPLLGSSLLQAASARADTKYDFQQWSLIFVNHRLDNNWSASRQVENRLRDDASEVNKQIFKPGGYQAFTDTLKLGVGGKMSKKLKVEVGYLQDYQRERKGPNLSNQALRLQFLVDTKGLHPFFAGT